MAAEDLLARVGSMNLDDVGDEVERLRKENEALKRKVTSLEVAKDGAVGEAGRVPAHLLLSRAPSPPHHITHPITLPSTPLATNPRSVLTAFLVERRSSLLFASHRIAHPDVRFVNPTPGGFLRRRTPPHGIGVERPALEIPYDELDIRDQIGGGGFSLVYRAFWKGTPVAVKRWFDPDQTDAVMQEFREEVMTMQDLKHPHCVQLIGACSKPPNLAIVMEYMPYSLHFILHQSPDIKVDRKRALNFGGGSLSHGVVRRGGEWRLGAH